MSTLVIEAFESAFDDQLRRADSVAETIKKIRKDLFANTTGKIIKRNEKLWDQLCI
jgi:hypothetical protein